MHGQNGLVVLESMMMTGELAAVHALYALASGLLGGVKDLPSLRE